MSCFGAFPRSGTLSGLGLRVDASTAESITYVRTCTQAYQRKPLASTLSNGKLSINFDQRNP